MDEVKQGLLKQTQAKIRDGTQDKMGQSRKGHSKTGAECSKTQKDVRKQDRMF